MPRNMPPRVPGCNGTGWDELAQKNPHIRGFMGFCESFWTAWDDMELEDGAGTRIRTGDLPLTRRLLYQLSYAGMACGRAAAEF